MELLEEESENGGSHVFFFRLTIWGEMIFFSIRGENGRERVCEFDEKLSVYPLLPI